MDLLTMNELLITSKMNSFFGFRKTDKRKSLADEIIELKTKIHQANFNIYSKIFRMSEIKNIISKLRSISTNEPRSYSDSVDAKYVIDISEKEIDEMIERYELEIEAIQEELEVHNHSKDI